MTEGDDNLEESIRRSLIESSDVKARLGADWSDAIATAARLALRTLASGNRLFIFGNGGSAADAQHFAAELVGRFKRDRSGLPAVALTTDTSALTALSNDFGFESVFARQVVALGGPGDLVVGISTSGDSENVVEGVLAAKRIGAHAIGLCGESGGRLAELVDVAVKVPSVDTARIQEGHIAVIHAICEVIDRTPVSEPGATGRAVGWDELLELRERWRTEGKTVVWTNGCFDLLHVGHIRSLQSARSLGDVLVVGINSDETVSRLKGRAPVIPAQERAEILASLRFVDYVVVFTEPTPEESLRRLQPDIHSKGSDYKADNDARLPEAAVVREYGGRIEYLPFVEEHSTTAILDKVAQSLSSST